MGRSQRVLIVLVALGLGSLVLAPESPAQELGERPIRILVLDQGGEPIGGFPVAIYARQDDPTRIWEGVTDDAGHVLGPTIAALTARGADRRL